MEFDRCFRNDGDDTRPESECWLDIRHNAGFNQQAETLLDEVKQVQAELRQSQDRMIQVELAMIDQRRHPLDYKVELPLIRTDADYQSPIESKFSPEFYEKMAGLIAEPEVRALSLSVGDFQCLKLGCIEQRKRSSEDPLQMARDWYLSLGIGTDAVLDGWNAEALIFSEGLGYGDMLVLQHGVYDGLLRKGKFRQLLCQQDAGELEGYRRVTGPGWVLYEDLMPIEEIDKWCGMRFLKSAWSRKK
ncbi:MAG: hypothetical protein OJI67_14150 [Prosthecobacter sp.]|nr:hypothetical protein [Prosthecobacter sp.]